MLFELAIIKMLNDMRSNGSSLKCVYMAPTKVTLSPVLSLPASERFAQALCSERQRDWSAKFDPLGIKCTLLYVVVGLSAHALAIRLRVDRGHCFVRQGCMGRC